MTPQRHTATLNAGQEELVRARDVRTLVAQGGYRSGKTFAGAALVVDRGRIEWPMPLLFGAPTWAMVEQVFVETLRSACDAWGVHCEWVRNRREITLFRRRPVRIFVRSLDHPRAAEGLTVAGAVVDEWELCDPQAIKVVKARITSGKLRQLALLGTPEGYGPAYDLILKHPAPSTRVITMPTAGNVQHLGEDYIDELSHLLDEQEQSEKLEGLRASKGGRVYSRFRRAVHVDVDHTSRSSRRVQLWCDFNVGRYNWLVVHVDDHGNAWVAKEIIVDDADTAEACQRALVSLAEHMGRTVDDVRALGIEAPCDASGRHRQAMSSHVEVMRGFGFRPRYHSSNPAIEDRVLSVQMRLKEQRLKVAPSCEWLIRALEQQGRDATGAPAKAKDPRQDLSGPLDALGYGVWWHWPAIRFRANMAHLAQQAALDSQRRASLRTYGDDVIG